MGVKGAKNKKARLDVKRNLKASERCHLCKQLVQDLDQHIRTEHSFVCARCGQRFAAERPWKQHMRDRHGLLEADAIKDDRKKKIEKWVQGKKSNGGAEAPSRGLSQPDVEDNDAVATQNPFAASAEASQGHRHVCELCGAEHTLPVDLSAQGLSFQCALAGQRCRGSVLSAPGMPTPQATPTSFMPGCLPVSSPGGQGFGFGAAAIPAVNVAMGEASAPAVQAAAPGVATVCAAGAAPGLPQALANDMDLAMATAVPSDDEDL